MPGGCNTHRFTKKLEYAQELAEAGREKMWHNLSRTIFSWLICECRIHLSCSVLITPRANYTSVLVCRLLLAVSVSPDVLPLYKFSVLVLVNNMDATRKSVLIALFLKHGVKSIDISELYIATDCNTL